MTTSPGTTFSLIPEYETRNFPMNSARVQAMFVRREVFLGGGGSPDLDCFDDLDFSHRLRGEGRVVTLRPAAVSCARRFARRGAVGRRLRDLWLRCRFAGEVAGGAVRRGALSPNTVAGSGR